jgi:hypothetical protein
MAGLEQDDDVTPLPLDRPAVAAVAERDRLEVEKSGRSGATSGRGGA